MKYAIIVLIYEWNVTYYHVLCNTEAIGRPVTLSITRNRDWLMTFEPNRLVLHT